MATIKKFSNNEELKAVLTEALTASVQLVSTYERLGIKAPGALKGNLGEYASLIKLITIFPEAKIEFNGATYPGYDFTIQSKRIQVKSSFGSKRHTYTRGKVKGSYYRAETCPTIKKKILDDKKADFVILACFDSLIATKDPESLRLYIFSQTDFKYFSTRGCWSGKKGDYTIWRILEYNGLIAAGKKTTVDHYASDEYEKLFIQSLNNWEKLDIKKSL
jgi:hypothetical protein